jgi:hypothetical protein
VASRPLYADLRLYTKFFQPVRKLLFKERRGATMYKKYDQAQRPHQRLMKSHHLTKRDKLRLHQLYMA